MSLNQYTIHKKILANKEKQEWDKEHRFSYKLSYVSYDTLTLNNAHYQCEQYAQQSKSYQLHKMLYGKNTENEAIKLVVENKTSILNYIHIDRKQTDNGRISNIKLDVYDYHVSQMLLLKMGTNDNLFFSEKMAKIILKHFYEKNKNGQSHHFDKNSPNMDKVLKFVQSNIKQYSPNCLEVNTVIKEEREIRRKQKSCLLVGFFKQSNINTQRCSQDVENSCIQFMGSSFIPQL